jgi:hypothetical protein
MKGKSAELLLILFGLYFFSFLVVFMLFRRECFITISQNQCYSFHLLIIVIFLVFLKIMVKIKVKVIRHYYHLVIMIRNLYLKFYCFLFQLIDLV